MGEKDRFYKKIEQVIANRITLFLAMVLYVRSENYKNEMTYFGLMALKQYFRRELGPKKWQEEATLDERWNCFLTELLFKINKYYEEEKKEEHQNTSEETIKLSDKVEPLPISILDKNNSSQENNVDS